jgi:hypothetical protein
VHFVALLIRLLEVLIDCMTYRMYRFVVAWKVLHATMVLKALRRQGEQGGRPDA